jgi:hypothetical protein
MGPRAGLGNFEEKKLLPLPEFKHWIDMVVLKNKLA